MLFLGCSLYFNLQKPHCFKKDIQYKGSQHNGCKSIQEAYVHLQLTHQYFYLNLHFSNQESLKGIIQNRCSITPRLDLLKESWLLISTMFYIKLFLYIIIFTIEGH